MFLHKIAETVVSAQCAELQRLPKGMFRHFHDCRNGCFGTCAETVFGRNIRLPSHRGATQRHGSATYSITRYTCFAVDVMFSKTRAFRHTREGNLRGERLDHRRDVSHSSSKMGYRIVFGWLGVNKYVSGKPLALKN